MLGRRMIMQFHWHFVKLFSCCKEGRTFKVFFLFSFHSSRGVCSLTDYTIAELVVMSVAIRHYDPHQRRLLESQKQRDRQAQLFATSTPRSLTSHSVASSARRASSASNKPQQKASAEGSNRFQALNHELLVSVEEKNRRQHEEDRLAAISRQLADDALRQRSVAIVTPRPLTAVARCDAHAQSRPTPLTCKSPRKQHPAIVCDRSQEVAADDERDQLQRETHVSCNPLTQRPCSMPSYLVMRIHEQRKAAMERQRFEDAKRAAKSFPKGTEPLDPHVAERTRLFLVERAEEISCQLRRFPFASALTMSGARKKAELEAQLNDVEAALLKFQYPVVFVKASHPHLRTE